MKDFIEAIRFDIEEAIINPQADDEPHELYDPIRYIMSLGGKRIRPILALLSYNLMKDGYKEIMSPALAIEVFHNFTLMHDDIMDKAPLRRGRKTVHKKWNENVAILSGDVMLIKAYDLMLHYETPLLSTLLAKFNYCAAKVCEGQQYDMNFERRSQISEVEYLEMISLKTAELLAYSFEMGAFLAGAESEMCARLRQAGLDMGLGFQLMDDLLDVYADQQKFGKQIGGDIISNKKTYLLVRALELATGNLKEEIKYWIEKKSFDSYEKVNAVTAIYNELKIKDECEKKIKYYFDEALKAIEGLPFDSERKEPLIFLCKLLMKRDK